MIRALNVAAKRIVFRLRDIGRWLAGNNKPIQVLMIGLSSSLLLVVVGLGGYQYKQIDRETTVSMQGSHNFVWEFSKLEMELGRVQLALHKAKADSGNQQLLKEASKEYNIFASHVHAYRKGMETMYERESFQHAFSFSQAFLQKNDTYLEAGTVPVEVGVIDGILLESDALQTSIHKLVLDGYQVQSQRTADTLEQLRRVAWYYLLTSTVLLTLSVAWGWFLMRRLSSSSHRQRALKQLNKEFKDWATHDVLTGLPNRRLLADRLTQTMAASKRSGCYGAVIFLDLDNFKPVNDIHGHGVGDLLLIDVAHRLRTCVREVDSVARFGGDEFVVLLSELDANHVKSSEQALTIAETMRDALSRPYKLTTSHRPQTETSIEHHCTVSVGLALFIAHEANQEEVLKQADSAMYQAKQAGRNLVRIYSVATKL